jgi:hypothetical protein
MKSKRLKHNTKKTRKKKNRRTKKRIIGAGASQSTLIDSTKEQPTEIAPAQSFSEALAEIDREPTDDAVAPTVDHPTVVLPTPIPVEDDVPPLEKLLNSLELKGRTPENPSYKSLGPYVKFIYAHFIRKYESPCFLFNDQPYKHRAVLNYNVTTSTLHYPPSLGAQMRECIRRGTPVIFITLYMKSEDKVIKHVNLIVYRPFKKVVEQYEPHGPQMNTFEQYNVNVLKDKLKDLFEKKLQPELEEYTPVFKPAHEICPDRGFQSIENDIDTDEDGYCQMWTMFLMETILLNPTMNTVDIIDACLTIGESDPQYFKNLIRGYRQYIAHELRTYLSKYIKQDIGTQEAIDTMFSINYDELIEEMKDETSRRQLPPPPLHDSNMYDVDRLSDHHIDLYINLLKTNTFGSSTSGDKDELVKLMTQHKLNMKSLIEFAYDTYFEQLSKTEMNNIMFWFKYTSYPTSILDLTYPDEKIEETKQHIKQKYPEFHIFYFRLEHYKKLRQMSEMPLATIEDAQYDPYELTKFYFFMKNHRPGSQEEIESEPIFSALSNPQLRNEQVEKILSLLHQFQLTFVELLIWLRLFE